MTLNINEITQELRALLAEGKSPAEAVTVALERGRQSGLRQLTLAPTELVSLSRAIRSVLPNMTLVELARLLRPHSSSVQELAQALNKEISPPPKALDLARALLDKEVYPQTSREEMKAALTACGHDEATTIHTLHLCYPSFSEVFANRPWQSTGIRLQEGEKACIEYQSGSWFISPQISNCGADGDRRFIARSGYTLPGSPEGGLIGRIGNHVFWVGQRGETPPGIVGTLELCPNDDLMGTYGAGLKDNSGSLKMKITLMQR